MPIRLGIGRRAPTLSRRRGRHNGFTLVEALIACAVVGVLAAILVLSFRPSNDATAVAEAERAKRWLQHVFYMALVEGRFFELKYSAALSTSITVHWFDTNEDETFESGGKCYFKSDGSSIRSSYSYLWHTLTPAVTFKITAVRSNKAKPLRYLAVSGKCLITLKSGP